MIAQFAQHWKTIRLITIVLSMVGGLLAVLLGYTGWGMLITVAFFLISSSLIYGFCYSWPFAFEGVAQLNRHLLRTRSTRGCFFTKVLFWLGLITTISAGVGLIRGDAVAALSVSAGLGLLAGCCHVFHQNTDKSEQ